MTTIINVNTLPWREAQSPGGKYGVAHRDVSLALGGQKDTGTWGGGHPFDVALARIPAGKRNYPLHSHTTQWEFYVVVSGHGELRTEKDTRSLGPGDCCVLPPGEAHQLHNTGDEDLVYYVVADNPPAEIVHYPDSDKWMLKPQRKWFRMQEVDYYDGEE